MNIADIRREYMLGGLSEEKANPDPFAQFESWLRDAILPVVGPRTYRATFEPLREPAVASRS